MVLCPTSKMMIAAIKIFCLASSAMHDNHEMVKNYKKIKQYSVNRPLYIEAIRIEDDNDVWFHYSTIATGSRT